MSMNDSMDEFGSSKRPPFEGKLEKSLIQNPNDVKLEGYT